MTKVFLRFLPYNNRHPPYAWAVPGMHRAGPGERGGASYGRRAVATAKWAAMQISGVGKGLRIRRLFPRSYLGADSERFTYGSN